MLALIPYSVNSRPAQAQRFLFAVALAALIACGGNSNEPRDLPNILLISIDTLRADHLGSYGYARPTSPRLDAFAEGATRYTNSSSPASWTLPAHASLFTGLYPPEHGVQMVRKEKGVKIDNELPIDGEITTLAEVLSGFGYRSAGVCANFMYLSDRYGLDKGFESWEVLPGKVEVETAPAQKVNAHALEWLGADRDGPFFLFLNYMETHTPYATRPHPDFPGHPVEPFSSETRAQHEKLVMNLSGPVPPEVIATVVDQYDLAIRHLDTGLGELFDALRAEGLFDNLLIVVTADHGEYLGERRLLGHAKDVLEGTLGVPLFVKEPGQRKGRVDERLISLVHLPRLILDKAGLAERVSPDVFPHRWPTETAYAKNRFSLWVDIVAPWGSRFDRVREVLYDASGKKFIESSDGTHELYDLVADPGELRNLVADDATLVAEWKNRLAAVRPETREVGERPEADPLSQEEIDRLRALGYME